MIARTRPAGEVFDIAVVGGGPAGSALAGFLARAGRSVVLLERERFPRSKLCGEFLSGEARDVLAAAGCLDPILAAQPARLGHLRFSSASGRTLCAPLPVEALGISRRVLDDTLFRNAGRLGATTWDGAEVTTVVDGPDLQRLDVRRGRHDLRVHAQLVIGAWGRRSPIR